MHQVFYHILMVSFVHMLINIFNRTNFLLWNFLWWVWSNTKFYRKNEIMREENTGFWQTTCDAVKKSREKWLEWFKICSLSPSSGVRHKLFRTREQPRTTLLLQGCFSSKRQFKGLCLYFLFYCVAQGKKELASQARSSLRMLCQHRIMYYNIMQYIMLAQHFNADAAYNSKKRFLQYNILITWEWQGGFNAQVTSGNITICQVTPQVLICAELCQHKICRTVLALEPWGNLCST